MKTILIVFLLFLYNVVLGQQTALQTQYMFNVLVYNPAYAGIHETTELSFSNRTQWVGLKGAPRTFNFSAHSSFGDNKFSAGINVLYDKIAVTKTTTINPSFVYRVKLSEKIRLAFGIQMGFMNYVAQLSALTTTSQGDMVFTEDLNRWMYNFGTGVYLYNEDWYIAMSAPKLLNNLFDPDVQYSPDIVNYAKVTRNYYFSGGYVFHLGENYSLKPNVLFQYSEGTYLQSNINANFYWRRNIGVGASYRVNESVSFLFEIFIKENLQIGYSYDYTVSKISSLAPGSHEIFISYRFPFDKEKSISPRYF